MSKSVLSASAVSGEVGGQFMRVGNGYVNYCVQPTNQPCSHQPATDPYPEPDAYNSQFP
jgi:hypothetical protein